MRRIRGIGAYEGMEGARDLARFQEEHAVVRGEARNPVLDQVREVPRHPARSRCGAGGRESEVASRGSPRSRAVAVVPRDARGGVDLGNAKGRLEQRRPAPGRPVEESLRVIDVVAPRAPVAVQSARPERGHAARRRHEDFEGPVAREVRQGGTRHRELIRAPKVQVRRGDRPAVGQEARGGEDVHGRALDERNLPRAASIEIRDDGRPRLGRTGVVTPEYGPIGPAQVVDGPGHDPHEDLRDPVAVHVRHRLASLAV